MKAKTKKEIQEFLKQKLETDDKWALKALLIVYRNQTADERSTESTIESNGIGFASTDAEILSSFAGQYQQRGWLSPRQMEILKKRIKFYWRQVMESPSFDREKVEQIMGKNAGHQMVIPVAA